MIVLLALSIQKFLQLLDLCVKILIHYFMIFDTLLLLVDQFIEVMIRLLASVKVLNIIKMVLHRCWWNPSV